MLDNIIRKALNTTVGIIAATTERMQTVIDDLVSKGKLSEEEGKKVVDDVLKNTDHKREEYEGRFRNIIDKALSTLNMPQADTYDKLEKRVKSLEVKLGLLAKEIDAQRKAAARNNNGAEEKEAVDAKKTTTKRGGKK